LICDLATHHAIFGTGEVSVRLIKLHKGHAHGISGSPVAPEDSFHPEGSRSGTKAVIYRRSATAKSSITPHFGTLEVEAQPVLDCPQLSRTDLKKKKQQ
jgi:hypothetical protein